VAGGTYDILAVDVMNSADGETKEDGDPSNAVIYRNRETQRTFRHTRTDFEMRIADGRFELLTTAPWIHEIPLASLHVDSRGHVHGRGVGGVDVEMVLHQRWPQCAHCKAELGAASMYLSGLEAHCVACDGLIHKDGSFLLKQQTGQLRRTDEEVD
jgi:hypothetical protein